MKFALALLLFCSTGLRATAEPHDVYPSLLSSLQDNDSQALPLAWDSVDLSRAQQKSGTEEKSSLDDLLHWAIEHSDHSELHDRAVKAQQAGGVAETLQRQLYLQQVLEQLRRQPTEAQLMQEAIGYLNNASSTDNERIAAAEALEVLVEPIDNAKDLTAMGALPPLVRMLEEGGPLGFAAAQVLGVAAANAAGIQTDILTNAPGVFKPLIQMARSEDDSAAKGLYAAAALMRNHPLGQAAFHEAGGVDALLHIMSAGCRLRVQRKAVALAVEMLEAPRPKGTGARIEQGLTAVPQLLTCPGDWDFREKVLAYVSLCAARQHDQTELCNTTLQARLKDMLGHAKADWQQEEIDAEYFEELQTSIGHALADVQSSCSAPQASAIA